jgi:membrane-bound lytic murein transglycosylase B
MASPQRFALIAAAAALLVLAQAPANAAARVSPTTGDRPSVRAFITEMVLEHGFDREQLADVFRQVTRVDKVIDLVKPAPKGKPRDWQRYRANALHSSRVAAGVTFWNDHSEALARAEAQYGVPAEIIVGIIGVETVYGRNTGSFRVLDALTTLAFDYPEAENRAARMRFFRRELEQTLLYASEARVDPLAIKGSYAGAVGLPQFMPSNIRRYAVDFDGNSTVDLRASPVDAIGSVAHFLSEHGWQRGMSVGAPARASAPDSAYHPAIASQGLSAKYTLRQLQDAGITGTEQLAHLPLGLINLPSPEAPTEYWLGTPNFFAITKYNRSFFYAMSVIELGGAVARERLTHAAIIQFH